MFALRGRQAGKWRLNEVEKRRFEAMNFPMKQIKMALLISGLMLCLALLPMWPTGYYTLLRLVVCGTCGTTAYYFKQVPLLSKHFWPLVFLVILFNPIAPVYLDFSLWLILDLGTALCLLTLAKKIQWNQTPSDGEE